MKTKHLFLFSMISTLGMPSLPAKEMASEPAVDKRPNLCTYSRTNTVCLLWEYGVILHIRRPFLL